MPFTFLVLPRSVSPAQRHRTTLRSSQWDRHGVDRCLRDDVSLYHSAMRRGKLDSYRPLPYKSYDSVFVWESGANPERPRHCKRGGGKRARHWRNQRWEGSFHPKKREPGDRLSSRRSESASKERPVAIPEVDRTIRIVFGEIGPASVFCSRRKTRLVSFSIRREFNSARR